MAFCAGGTKFALDCWELNWRVAHEKIDMEIVKRVSASINIKMWRFF